MIFLQLAMVLAAAYVLSGCGGWMHGWTLTRYEGKLLSVPAGPGLERLGIERSFDPSVDQFVNTHGIPDLLYVADGNNLQLVYLEKKLVATFHRSSLSNISSVSIEKGIPPALAQTLTAQTEPAPQERPAEESIPAATESEEPAAGFGTCFAVAPHGLLITSNHVVANATRVIVRFADAKPIPASILTRDPTNDVALLSTGTPTPVFLSFGRANASALGDPLFTIGFPAPQFLGLEPKYTEGVLSAKSGPSDTPTLLQITIPIQPGNSGGPVIDKRGQVIGVIAATAAVEAFYGLTQAFPQNLGLLQSVCVALTVGRSYLREHAREDLEPEVFLVA